MAKRGRKKKPAPVSVAGQFGRAIVFGQADDPYEAGAKRTVARNALVSPLTAIYHRGRLVGPNESEADGEARRLAGEWFRTIYERAEMSDSKAIDYSAVKVDVSFSYRGLSDSAAHAFEELKRIAADLGPLYDCVYKIVGQELWFESYCRQKYKRDPGRQERLDAYQELRDALDALIIYRGVATGRRSKMRAEIFASVDCVHNETIQEQSSGEYASQNT